MLTGIHGKANVKLPVFNEVPYNEDV